MALAVEGAEKEHYAWDLQNSFNLESDIPARHLVKSFHDDLCPYLKSTGGGLTLFTHSAIIYR